MRGFTFWDLLICLAAVGLLVLLLPGLMPRHSTRAPRINCVSNLKQIGLAFRMWSNDHGDKFSWQVSMATNGTLELAESPEVFRHFLAASNELNTPKVLACPTDTKRVKAVEWSSFGNSNLSYFVGLDSDESKPQTILSGDRNVTGGVVTASVMRFYTNSLAGWDGELHHLAGNIGLGDGSVVLSTSQNLRKQIIFALEATNQAFLRLAMPK
jgi:hypothetical protein